MGTRNPDGENTSTRFTAGDAVKYLVAVIALVGFAWFIVYLMGRTTSASELEWTRAVYLLSGVEAIAFAAAGFLFGKEVNRQRAENAERRATETARGEVEAREKATEAETKGRSLASAIRAKVEGLAQKRSDLEAFGTGAGGASARADYDELKRLAEELFPD